MALLQLAVGSALWNCHGGTPFDLNTAPLAGGPAEFGSGGAFSGEGGEAGVHVAHSGGERSVSRGDGGNLGWGGAPSGGAHPLGGASGGSVVAGVGGSGGGGSGGAATGGSETGGAGGAATGGSETGGAGPTGPTRLPFAPEFCWVWRDGELSLEAWNAMRLAYESVISSWEGASGLEIRWEGICDPAMMGNTADVRILLDHRLARGDAIDGCEQLDREGPWAIRPDEAEAFDDCQWNAVLPVGLGQASPILHTAGHALGFVHEHVADERGAFDPESGCPLVPLLATTPYLREYDARSVMHAGPAEAEAYLGNSWLSCEPVTETEILARPTVADDLSSGDRLALEMVYPSSLQHVLGATGWLTSDGIPVFRSDMPIRLESDWSYRGASPEWFRGAYWSTAELLGTATLSYELVKELPPGGPEIQQVSHFFTDPFGDLHWLAEVVETSNSRHTAVLLSTLP